MKVLWAAVLAAMTLAASSSPTYAIAAWNIECRGLLMEWKKKPLRKAFVTGRVGDREWCWSSWGARSKDAAIKRALDQCKKSTNRDCVVHSAE